MFATDVRLGSLTGRFSRAGVESGTIQVWTPNVLREHVVGNVTPQFGPQVEFGPQMSQMGAKPVVCVLTAVWTPRVSGPG